MRLLIRLSLIALFGSLLAVGIGSTAGAQNGDPYSGPTPSVLSETTLLGPQEAAAPAAQVRNDTLAFSGGDVAALALMGAGLVGVGALALAARRRSALNV